MARRVTWTAAMTLVGVALACVSILIAPALAGAAPSERKADRDRDKVFDDLESRLAGDPAGSRVSVIVRLRDPATSGRVRSLEGDVGDFDVQDRFQVIDAFAAKMSKRQVLALAKNRDVVHVEENSVVRKVNASAQQSFGVTEARTDGTGLDGDGDGNPASYSPGDLVAAVIDTGIDAAHPDLNGGKVIAFKDFVNARTAAYDDDGHGSHVSGTIAGEGAGAADGKGVAPAGGLVGVKVLDQNGSGTMANVTAGIDWVVQNRATYGIEAINLSLGTSGCSGGTDSTSAAVNAAHDAGIVVAVAAGNSGPGTCTIGSPGAAAKAVTVGAMADMGVNGFKQAYFSSRGKTLDGRIKPDVSAPGVSITSAQANTGGYVIFSGTSMATPFTAGVSLLMRDANGGLTSQQVKDQLMQTAIDWGRGGDNKTAGSTGADIDYGAGRLDAYAAIAAAGAGGLTSPPPTPSHELREGSLSGTGAQVEYQLNVTDTSFPIAATLIHPSVSGGSASSPDFDLYLIAPNGAQVAAAETTRRQDELGFKPTLTGTYTLRVRSWSGSGPYFVDTSAGTTPPPPDTTAPAAPSGLTATGGDQSVALDWADSGEPDIAGYRVYRDGGTTPIATPSASAYTDTGRTNGTSYSYTVTAVDRSGNESAAAGPVSATPVAPPPAPTVKSYQPAGYTPIIGTAVSDRSAVSRLFSNDGSRVEVNSAAAVGGVRTSEIQPFATITAAERSTLSKLTVNFDGNVSSSSAKLTVRIRNNGTGQWETIFDPPTGSTNDRSTTWSRTTGVSNYVSPTGEIRLRVTGTRSSSFRTRTDWVRFTIEY